MTSLTQNEMEMIRADVNFVAPAARANACRSDDGALKGKRILFIRASGDTRHEMYHHLKSLGVTVVVAHPNIAPWAKEIVDEWITCDSHDFPLLVEAVQAHIKEVGKGFDGVMTFDEYGVSPCCRLGPILGCVATPAQEACVTATQCKNKFREFCKQNGVPFAKYMVVKTQEDIPKVASEVPYPVIAKPTQGAGSSCVTRCQSEEDLLMAFRRVEEGPKASGAYAHWAFEQEVSLLVEELLVGPEIDIDILVQNGRIEYASISDNLAAEPPYFLEMGGYAPSKLPEETQEQVLSMAQAWCSAHGESLNTAIHMEAICTPRGPVMIEANLRVGGAETHTLNRMGNGVDLGEGAARIACGLPIGGWLPEPVGTKGGVNKVPRQKHVRSTNFQLPKSGKLSKQDVSQAVVDAEGFGRIKLYWSVGAVLRLPPEGQDYLGWMAVCGDSHEETEQNMARCSEGVVFGVEDDA